ncbi:EAL domain-containing response regulator [Duganella sp. PWIR1]
MIYPSSAFQAADARPFPPWAGATALVVEDSLTQRAHLASLLQQLGFGLVLGARDGYEALRLLEQPEHDVFLVVSDLAMPGMDGIELSCQLIDRQLVPKLVVVSAQDTRLLDLVENMRRTDAGGVLLGALSKPVQLAPLEALLKQRPAPPGVLAPPDIPQVTEAELGAALKQGQFVPWFHPRIGMRDGELKGVEALARWRHPTRGLLEPQHFIAALEGSSLLAEFTLAIVRQVLVQLAQWQRTVLPGLTASINLPAGILGERRFVDRLAALTASTGIAPATLVWEVSETMVMRQPLPTLINLGRLRLMGFGLAMDDFGIGYSSVRQLARCPFTELKIDRVFVDGATRWPHRRAVLCSAIELGQRFKATTVAEGVETESDWLLLRQLGCEQAQGYLLALPMPPEELIDWQQDARERLHALAAMT